MVKPASRFVLAAGYSEPTIVEMFGLKKPLPTIRRPSAPKSAHSCSTAISRWPPAMRRPPQMTASRAPR
jgi:hypothetical protein